MSTFNVAGGGTYNLGSSIGSTDTSILLSSFLEPVSNVPYTMVLLNTDIAFGTIAPGTTSSEFISFTGITQNANGTALLTGVTRGLAKKYPFTTSSTFKLPHSGQSIFILSDVPQVFTQYASKVNNETIAGDWDFTGQVTFDTFPITPSNTPATTNALGIVKISVAPASAPSPIAVGINDPRVPVAYAVDSVGTDAYAITPSPAITAYAAGQQFTFKAGTANTGAATLNVSALGAKTIKKNVSTDLATGDILVNQIVTVVYDGTNMQMVAVPPAPIPTVQTFLASGTYTKPAGMKYAIVQIWAGGGGGATGTGTNGPMGGGGGAYNTITLLASAIGTTETVTVGAGGAAVTGINVSGNNGGNSSFGSLITIYGGGGGSNATQLGTGGGIKSVGTSGGIGGAPVGGLFGVAPNLNASVYGGGGAGTNGATLGGASVYGGGGAGFSSGGNGGDGGGSYYGGGGGGGGNTGSLQSGGTSIVGGNGGSGGDGTFIATAGAVPGGGGGGSRSNSVASGAGGAGKVIVTEYY